MKMTDLIKNIILASLVLLLLFLTKCAAIEKAGQSAGDGLKSSLDTSYTNQLSRSLIKNVIDELAQESNQAKIEGLLEGVMAQLKDSLNQMSNELRENLIGEQTEGQLEQMVGALSSQIADLLKETKSNLLNEDLEIYLEHMLNEVLKKELMGIVDGLWYELSDEAKINPRIRSLRLVLENHLDSLIQSASKSVSERSDTLLKPILADATDRAESLIDDTQSKTKGIIRYALIGLAVLLLIGGLIFQLFWKNRYKTMLGIISKNIDEINSQKVYDQLTGSIRESMEQRGLEQVLRNRILEEQGLLEQKEWDDKDQQLLRLFMEEMQGNEESTTRGLGASFVDQVRQRANDLGLGTHLESWLRRMNKN